MEILEGIHHVDGVNANVYVVVEGKELTVIDTGMPGNSGKILKYIEKMGRKPTDVSRIVLTHFHIDHAGSAHELRKLTKARLAVHEGDVDFVAGRKIQPKPKNILLRAASSFIKFTPVIPDIVLNENDKVGRLAVIHTPGHTTGSISLYELESKVLFVGDAIRFTDKKLAGPPEQFTADMKKAVESIGKISGLDFDVMLSGHGEPLKPDASGKVKEFYVSLKK
jgi:glyoxylase-like metal-dependent hydrolase (beta-lactamase superfamily II)